MRPIEAARWSELADRVPAAALVENVDLVIVRWDDTHSVLDGRCLHRGALLSDGHIRNDDLVCGLHNWDYRYDTGISSYDNSERLHKFNSGVEGDSLMVDAGGVAAWEATNPQPYDRSAYQGTYQDHVTCGSSIAWPPQASTRTALTGRSHRWGFPPIDCRLGTTFRYSPRNWRGSHSSTTLQWEPT